MTLILDEPERPNVTNSIETIWRHNSRCAAVIPFEFDSRRLAMIIEYMPQFQDNVIVNRKFNIGIAELDEHTSLPDTSTVPVNTYMIEGIDQNKHALGSPFRIGKNIALVRKGKIVIIGALNGIEIPDRSDLEALCSAIQNAFIEGHRDSDIQNALRQVAVLRNGNSAETFRQALGTSD